MKPCRFCKREKEYGSFLCCHCYKKMSFFTPKNLIGRLLYKLGVR